MKFFEIYEIQNYLTFYAAIVFMFTPLFFFVNYLSTLGFNMPNLVLTLKQNTFNKNIDIEYLTTRFFSYYCTENFACLSLLLHFYFINFKWLNQKKKIIDIYKYKITIFYVSINYYVLFLDGKIKNTYI